MVDKTVLGSVVLGLQSTEECLFSTKDLEGTGRALGEVGQATGVGDQTSTNQVTNQGRQVRCNRVHTRGQVASKLLTVFSEADNLLGQGLDVLQIILADLSTHGSVSGVPDSTLDLFGENLGEIGRFPVGTHAHLQNEPRVGNVVVKNLGQFREMPAVPLLHTHGVCVQFFVQVVQEGNGLDNHSIDLVRRELQLVSGKRVGQTKRHRRHVLGKKARD